MAIKIEHKGMEIRWSENEDAWSCMEMQFSNPSLAKVKAKIDAFRLKERKAIKVPALLLSAYGRIEATPCEIIEYLGPKHRSRTETVAVMRSRYSNERASRNEDSMEHMVLDTPEARAAIDKAKELQRQADALSSQASKLMNSIPRLTLDDIAELVKHKEYSDE